MAMTPSTMLPLGTEAPPFELPDVDGPTWSLDDFRGAPGLLVIFLSNHCPFVKHIRTELAVFARDVQEKGLSVVAISSNDVETHPEDGPEMMAQEKRDAGYPFPYLFDETQKVAKAYRAACTPDFFLFDGDFRLVYRGQFDGSRPGNDVPVTGADLRAAAEALLAGDAVSLDQHPSIGCNIKWKKGNSPDYFSG